LQVSLAFRFAFAILESLKRNRRNKMFKVYAPKDSTQVLTGEYSSLAEALEAMKAQQALAEAFGQRGFAQVIEGRYIVADGAVGHFDTRFKNETPRNMHFGA
jgi:hypothetical protein